MTDNDAATLATLRDPLWHIVSMDQLHHHRIVREITCSAEPFEAPEWRAGWVERIEPA